MIDVDRFADLEESTSVVALLSSDAASYVTSSTYPIDGGGTPGVDV